MGAIRRFIILRPDGTWLRDQVLNEISGNLYLALTYGTFRRNERLDVWDYVVDNGKTQAVEIS